MTNHKHIANPIALYQPNKDYNAQDNHASQLENTVKILENYQIFQALSEAEQKTLLQNVRIKRYYHQQMVYQQNSSCNELNIVLSGALKLGWTVPCGRYYADIIIPTGTIINVVPVINHQPYTHDHIAIGNTILANINADIFLEIIQNNAKVMYMLLQLISLRTQMSWERIVYQTTTSLRTRLAKELVYLVDFHSYQDNDKYILNLKLTQENFAELLQTTRQSINKELAKFSQEQLIEVKYNQTDILNYSRLKQISMNESSIFSTQFR